MKTKQKPKQTTDELYVELEVLIAEFTGETDIPKVRRALNRLFDSVKPDKS